ncbi:VOC family protein [Cellulomonas composti]|uniref:VOC domain-containing protein n=1 Tax=Cellulomonas composti TaxID=266130 RepID=A0A511J6U4_9CELL|nr:hypothetical protein CCO02nite_00810 [Cellulomonas composti]
MTERGAIHHVELWVPDLAVASASIGWLLGELGYTVADTWATGESWGRRDAYVVLEAGPDVTSERHERRRPGLNHLAFHAGAIADVDNLVERAGRHGWYLLFEDRHPWAGGPRHYAAYLENADGFEVELVADLQIARG